LPLPSWCLCAAVPIEQEGEGPKRGALFNQLVKELRSEYAAAVTACAQRIHSALADHRCSIRAALEKYGITNDSAVLMEQVTALCALKAAHSFALFVKIYVMSDVSQQCDTSMLQACGFEQLLPSTSHTTPMHSVDLQ